MEECERREIFLQMLKRGEEPYDYTRKIMNDHFKRFAAVLAGENPVPYEVEIQPTSRCDAGCEYCWGDKEARVKDRLTTKEAMERVISQLINWRGNGFKVETIKFCGSTGEPLVNPLTLYAIELAGGKKYLRLFTNGLRLGENRLNKDYMQRVAKVDRINLSLDAATTETLYCLKKGARNIGVRVEDILEATAILRQMGVIIDASFVITEKNYHEIAEFARKVKRFGAGDNAKYRIDFMDSSVSEKHGKEIHELLAEAEEEKKEEKDGKFGVVSIHSEDEIKNPCREILSSRCCGFKCFTCGLWACVAADGSVYPCGHIVSGDVKTYGNILFQEIEEIWESEKRKMLIGNLPIDKCWICSPFSLNTNKLGTFLVEWAREREISPEGLVAELHDEYTGRKEAAA